MGLSNLFKGKDKLLFEAVKSRNIKAIKAQHARGADLESWNNGCRTPLQFACIQYNGRLDVIKTLVDLGANVNTFDCCGGTPLHDIARYKFSRGDEKIAKFLLSNGADAHLKNDKGETPLYIARDRDRGRVVRAIEGHICLFSGWMREFYGDGVANRLDTRDVWVVVLPSGSSSTPSKPLELELAIYSATLCTIIALKNVKQKMLNVNQDDPAVVISYNSKESEIKLGPAKAGDKQQLQWFSNACKGNAREMQPANPVQPQAPSVAGIGPSTEEESELAMPIKASRQSLTKKKKEKASLQSLTKKKKEKASPQSAVEDILPHCGTQTQVVSESHASTSSTSSSKNTKHNGSAALDVPDSREGTSNKSKVHDFAPSDNLQAQHMDAKPDLPAVFYKTFESPSLIYAPSAPPIPDAIIDDGPIHYPSIDSTPIDYFSQYVESSSTIAAEMKKEAGITSCSICWDAPVEGAFLPCGHMAGCMSCSNDIKARNMGFPVCRADVDQVTRIYISSLTEKKE